MNLREVARTLRDRISPNPFFLSSVVLILILASVRYPSLTTRAEVWAETGTNFFYNAYYGGLWDNLWATDAGYLPWLQRFLAVIVVKAFGVVHYYPVVIQYCAVLFIALACSFINLRPFRALVPSDAVRFLLGLSLSVVPVYQAWTFVNFPYFGFFFALLVPFLDAERWGRGKLAGVCLFFFLLFSSKPYFLVFAPVVLALAVDHGRNRRWRSLALYAAAFISNCLQGGMILLTKVSGGPTVDSPALSSLSLPGMAGKAFNFLCQIILAVLAPFPLSGTVQVAGTLLLLAALAGTALYFTHRRGRTEVVRFFLLSLAVGYGAMLFSCLTLTAYSTGPMSWSTKFIPGAYLQWRSNFFASFAVYLGFAVLFLELVRRVPAQLVLAALLGLFFQGRDFFSRQVEFYPDPQDSWSRWALYHRLLALDSYCIPVNPYPWVMGRDCARIDLPSAVPGIPAQRIEVNPPGGGGDGTLWVRGLITGNDFFGRRAFLTAFDPAGRELGTAANISGWGEKTVYFVFPREVSPAFMSFVDGAGRSIPVASEMVVYGGKGKRAAPGR